MRCVMKDCERKGYSEYGSQMGRQEDKVPRNATGKMRLYRVPLKQGYDPGGAYWGAGAPLFCVELVTENEQYIEYFRAWTRDEVKEKFPLASFYRLPGEKSPVLKTPVLLSGYGFEFTGKRRWRASSDELWPVEMNTPDGKEKFVGTRRIDGYDCFVFKCSDGKFRAQM